MQHSQVAPSTLPPAEQFIAEHVRLFMSWRYEFGFETAMPDVVDLEASLAGPCLSRATLMAARCAGCELDVEVLWCRMNGIPHAIVRHIDSDLVSDHTLAEPRTLARRSDLTDLWPIEKMLKHYEDDASNVSDV
jgi:hypothetical protein